MKLLYKNTFPLCFISTSSLLIFKKNTFNNLDLSNGEISNIVCFKTSVKERILSKIPLVSRVLRKGIRCGIQASENLILFVVGQKIFELDINERSISNGFMASDKSRPLIFSKIEGVQKFTDGIYFGGYKGNPKKEPISIYRRVKKDEWEVVYKFPLGSIEHIHNVVADPYNDVVYIFTGDFDCSAGIWLAKDDFKSVTPILLGDQKFRGCIAFPTSEGLLYATDSPFIDNSIRLLKNCNGHWESIDLMNLNGPCIYGCQWQNEFVFSTSVEGDGRNQNIWYKLFGNKRGKGIKENASFIYKGSLKEGFKEVYRVEKDTLPFYVFQFGTLIFPSGHNESSYLPVFHIATRKHRMDMILLKRAEN